MKRGLRRPRNPLLIAVPWLLAAGAGAGTYQFVRQLDGEGMDPATVLARSTVGAVHARTVERQWIAEAFPELYLPAPVNDLPCATGIRAARPYNLRISEALSWVDEGRLDDAVDELGKIAREDPGQWTAPLALGMLLAREGRLSEAETVLAPLYQRQSVQSTIQRALDAARTRRASSGPSTEDVRGMIHLLHAYGYVLIETHRAGDDLWRTLKNPIGCAKLLALRGATNRMRRLPAWDEHRVSAPGCEPSAHSLTTLDLYNNLIVGYLSNPEFQETAERRAHELARDYKDPPHENPLLAVLQGAADGFGSESFPAEREHWLWAVSNAERLLKQRRDSGTGPLGNVRLAANLAALMESALDNSPPAARESLRRQKNALIDVAFDDRSQVLPRQQPDLHRALARLKLLEAVRSGSAAPLNALAAALDASGRANRATGGT